MDGLRTRTARGQRIVGRGTARAQGSARTGSPELTYDSQRWMPHASSRAAPSWPTSGGARSPSRSSRSRAALPGHRHRAGQGPQRQLPEGRRARSRPRRPRPRRRLRPPRRSRRPRRGSTGPASISDSCPPTSWSATVRRRSSTPASRQCRGDRHGTRRRRPRLGCRRPRDPDPQARRSRRQRGGGPRRRDERDRLCGRRGSRRDHVTARSRGGGGRRCGLRAADRGDAGHTPGHVAVLDEIGGILVAGDALGTSGGTVTGPNPQFSEDLAAARHPSRRWGHSASRRCWSGTETRS